MGKILFGVTIVLMIFLVAFVVLFVASVDALGNSVATQFGAKALAGWMLDTPQPIVSDFYGLSGNTHPPDGNVFSGGRVDFDGYSGATSFECRLPVEQGVLTDGYGVPRDPFPAHSGIDYGTCYQQNLTVFTPMGGKVIFTGWSPVGYGNLVVIENAGWQVYLAHNNSFLVHVGDLVQAGDAVALSGTTGNSTGPHVHFEVRACTHGVCTPRNPNLVLLPGQISACDWYSLSIACRRK